MDHALPIPGNRTPTRIVFECFPAMLALFFAPPNILHRTAMATEADVLILEANRLYEEDHYVRAEQVARKALELARNETPTVTFKVALPNQILIYIYMETDAVTKAQEQAEGNLAFVKNAAGYSQFKDYVLKYGSKAFGKRAPGYPLVEDWLPLPTAFRMLSSVYVKQQKGPEAEGLAREALLLSQRMLGSHSSEVADSNIALAEAYMAQDKPTLAIPALEQAASLYEDIGEYEDAANVEEDIAELLRDCGEDARATKFEFRARLLRQFAYVRGWVVAFPFGLTGLLSSAAALVVVSALVYRRWKQTRRAK